MSRHVVNGLYVFAAAVVCPLLAWNLAVAGADHGYGWGGFFIVLLRHRRAAARTAFA